jgi:hypothetical protein
MTLEEKVGMLFQPLIASTRRGTLIETWPRVPQTIPTSELVAGRHILHFDTVATVAPDKMARWHNYLQEMEAVRAQKEDLPYDSEDPLYPFGHGLTYE